MAPSGAHRSEAEPPRLEGGKFRATARNDGARCAHTWGDAMRDNTGLGLGYRFAWRLEYIGVSCFGPAQHMPATDPKRRLRRERAARVIAAHEARGTEAPEWVRQIVETGGDAPVKQRRADKAPAA